MKKYDKYENELTRYIDMLTSISIKDILGDIVGDIIEADIPINIPSGDTELDITTPVGIMHIKLEKNYIQEVLHIYHKIGEKFYGEYIIDSNDIILENKVKGLILEKRKEGIVLTEITRKYIPC